MGALPARPLPPPTRVRLRLRLPHRSRPALLVGRDLGLGWLSGVAAWNPGERPLSTAAWQPGGRRRRGPDRHLYLPFLWAAARPTPTCWSAAPSWAFPPPTPGRTWPGPRWRASVRGGHHPEGRRGRDRRARGAGVTVGAGTRRPAWLQIKADVTGCAVEARGLPEATLLGAALVAGAGAGSTPASPRPRSRAPCRGQLVAPDPARHLAYCRLFEAGFEPVSAALHNTPPRATPNEARP